MASDLHVHTRLAKVARGELRQHELRVFSRESTLALFSALGMPRLWGYALDAAIRGFDEGFARPFDGQASSRLQQALEGAQRQLRAKLDALIERRMPDVGLLAITHEGPLLHVLCVGPGRIYVREGDATRRLTPRDDRAEGLLGATPTWCTEPVHAGDLVLGGSLSSFVDDKLTALGQLLDARPDLTPREIVEQLNASPGEDAPASATFAFQV